MDHLENKSIFNIGVTEETRTQFNGLSQWMNINAIIGLAGVGLTIISTILTIVKMSKYGSSVTGSVYSSTFVSVAISLLLNITLLNAAKFMKNGVTETNQGFFSLGINKLATYFKIMGIIMIIVLVLCVLVFLIFGLATGMRGGMR